MNWSALLWLLLLLLANGFFVAAEFAYITASSHVLERRAGRAAGIAVGLNRNLSVSLAAAQLGITMASLLLGFVAEPAIASILERVLGFLPISETVVHGIALGIALLFIVFLHMVIGEMAPKNIAISSPERSAIAMALPFRAFTIVFKPLIFVLNGIANGILRSFGVRPIDNLEAGHSAEDLATIIASGRKEGVIEDFAHRLLSGAIVFGDLDASEVMVPRPDIDAARSDATVAEIEELMRTTGHTRIPIHTGDQHDMIGFAHVKDLMAVDDDRRDQPLDAALIRPALVVPGTARLQSVLDEMRKTRRHLAIVVDEYGSTAGIMTMQDIAEELVGEIRDEHDRGELRVRVEHDRIVAAGSVRPDELTRFGVDLPSGEYETLGGLVMERLGRVPKRGDVIEDDGWSLRVTSTIGRRVERVEITNIDTHASAK